MSYELDTAAFMELIDNFLKVYSNEFEDKKFKQKFAEMMRFNFLPHMFGSGFFFGTHDHQLAEIYITAVYQRKQIKKLMKQIKKLKENI